MKDALANTGTEIMARLPASVAGKVHGARLPFSYEQAKSALSRCTDIDECAAWQNRAVAMASYAKQAGDFTMERMAQRIRLRAILKLGELLAAIPETSGRAAAGQPTRASLMRDAGVRSTLGSRAVAMTRVPLEKREEMIERDPPATISEFERIGRPAKPKLARVDGNRILSGLDGFVRWMRRNPPCDLGNLPASEIERLRGMIEGAREWLDELQSASV